MKFEISHCLGKAKAKRRIANRLPKLEEHIPGGGTVESDWTAEDRLKLDIKAMGQTIGVTIDVEDDKVSGAVAVPMMLSMMSGVIRDFVETSARRMLDKPVAAESAGA